MEGSDFQDVDKLRLNFLEEELKSYKSWLSASNSFILAQLQLIHNWIEYNFESQIIDTSCSTYQNYMQSCDVKRIGSIAKQIKYGNSNTKSSKNANNYVVIGTDEPAVPINYNELDKPVEEEEEEEEIHQENETHDDLTRSDLTLACENSQEEEEVHEQKFDENLPGDERPTLPILQIFTCKQCHKKFPFLFQLNKHLKLHTNERSTYNFSQCHLQFKTQSNLNEHTKYIHCTEAAKYNCKLCKISFTNQHDLIKHERRHKSGKHICSTCHKKLTTSLGRIQHERTHKKPYKCSACPKNFALKSSLETHLNSAHGKAKPYSFSLCSKKFIRLAHLKYYEGVHEDQKPYKCKFCDKG